MLKRLTALFAIVLLVAPLVAEAQQRRRDDDNPGLIRDAEIETILRLYAKPVLDASGLGSDNVQIHIVNDPRLNAFVAGGQHIFLNTGLLMRSDRPEQVGVRLKPTRRALATDPQPSLYSHIRPAN